MTSTASPIPHTDRAPRGAVGAVSPTTLRRLMGLAITGMAYSALVLASQAGAVDRAAGTFVLILGMYLALRPRNILHPATPVFLNYLLYVCMPYLLFWVYRTWEIEYILPWGMTNDWSALSTRTLMHFEIAFSCFYLLLYILARQNPTTLERDAAVARTVSFEVKLPGVVVLAAALLVGSLVFLNYTGGITAWVTNYSSTYINNRAGAGLLNYLLLQFSHVLAFVAGWMMWRGTRSVPRWVWAAILVPLLMCIMLQGIKSRIPVLLFFFLMPRLSTVHLKLGKSVLIFLGLIVFFMVSMYFRSEGYYATPRMALEYLQSYFNTIFLHDLTVAHFGEGELQSMAMGMKKYSEIFVGKLPREEYDLSVALTQQFFPSHWYEGGGTQQWPIESDFFLTFPSPIFWVVPIGIYAMILSYLYRSLRRGLPIIMFFYAAEFIRMMSIFRSGLLTWDGILQIVFYGVVYVFCATQIFTRVANRRTAIQLHRPRLP